MQTPINNDLNNNKTTVQFKIHPRCNRTLLCQKYNTGRVSSGVFLSQTHKTDLKPIKTARQNTVSASQISSQIVTHTFLFIAYTQLF